MVVTTRLFDSRVLSKGADSRRFWQGNPARFAALADFATGYQEIFVSGAGNDETGLGTQASPYRNILRAVQEIPPFFAGIIVIRLVGAGPFPMPQEFPYLAAGFTGGIQIVGDLSGASTTVTLSAGANPANPSGGTRKGVWQYTGLAAMPVLSDGSHWAESSFDWTGNSQFYYTGYTLDGANSNGPAGTLQLIKANDPFLEGTTTLRIRPLTSVLTGIDSTSPTGLWSHFPIVIVGCILGQPADFIVNLTGFAVEGCRVDKIANIFYPPIWSNNAVFNETVNFRGNQLSTVTGLGGLYTKRCSLMGGHYIMYGAVFKGTGGGVMFIAGPQLHKGAEALPTSLQMGECDFSRASPSTATAITLVNTSTELCDDSSGISFHNYQHAIDVTLFSDARVASLTPGLSGRTSGVCVRVSEFAQAIGFAGMTGLDNSATPGANLQFLPSGRTYSFADITTAGGIVDIPSMSRAPLSSGAARPDNRATVLTYATSVALDFTATLSPNRTITLSGNITFTTSNRFDGGFIRLRIIPGASLRTLTFPAWKFLGAAAPASIAANKEATLTLYCYGANDTDIHATYAVEP